MKRKECKNDDEVKRLDTVNSERLETSQRRIAHAIKILNECKLVDNDIEKTKLEISHAVNLLEAAVQEMEWHCEWFGYNDEICLQIDDAVACLGKALSLFFDDDSFENGKFEDWMLVKCYITDACAKLAKALATLIRWNDETVDVSEV